MRLRLTLLMVLLLALVVIGPVLAQSEAETVVLLVEGMV